MSNLSELLPAGAGAKSADFVASGTLGSGVTVALQSDGTVEVVAAGGPESAAPVSFSASSISVTPGSAYHATANKVIVFYRNTVSTYPTAVVGTVSGTAISFGSEIAIGTRINPLGTAVVYDSANDKLVFCVASGGFVYAYVGTLSGTSISIGSEANVSYGGSSAPLLGAVYDINSGKTVVTAQRGDNTYAQSVVLTVSGTTPSFGTAVVANSAASYDITSVYDENAQKVGVFYRVGGTFYGKVGTVSGTSISFGTQSSGISGTPAYADSCYDSNTQKIVIVYSLNALTNRPYCVVATISGTTLTFGTNVEINTVRADSNAISYDSTAQKVVITNYVYNASPQVTVGTVSGTSISYGTTNTLATSTGLSLPLKSVYDPSADKTIISTQVSTVSGASSVVFSTSSTNSADFIGITDQAIADTATGAVIVQGGVNSSNAGASIPFELSLGSAAVFESGGTSHIAPVYDTNAQKVVVAYSDNNNGGYGTAVVGTVSGSSITFGTPVVFRSSNTSRSISAAYDANAQKIVIAYSDVGRFSIGYILVGTVSGTSISFGSEASNNVTCNYLSVIYAPDVQKIVVSYQNEDNSFKATSIVGTVSGTSISFGTAAIFTAGRVNYVSSAYDTTNNKVVVSYQDQNNAFYGTAAVGTISGTSISFGTPVVFEAANSVFLSTTYDTAQQKIVISYQDNGNSNYGTAVVGTVSGTSISFGTPVVFEAAEANLTWAIYDPNSQKVIISYQDNGNSNYGTVVLGTVSGTSISFGTPSVFYAGSTSYPYSVYNTDLQKIVFTYRNSVSSPYPGTAVVGTLSGGAFTPNTDYYVQADGSLSTTVSSVPAGRALSTTSILLEG